MHPYTVNASIQLVPLTQNKHAYDWVDEAIEVIRNSGIRYEVGPFATVVEGKYDEVLKVINDINEYLFQHACEEWITSVQIQFRSAEDITGDIKTSKHAQ